MDEDKTMNPGLAWFMKEIMAQARSIDRQISGLPENVGVAVRQSVLDILKEKEQDANQKEEI